MNGLDFFSTFPTPANNNSNVVEEEDDWGDFVVNSSDVPSRTKSLPITSDPPSGLDFLADRNGLGSTEPTRTDSMPGRRDSVKPRGPVPLSVFGVEEEEEGGDGSGATDSSLYSAFSSFSDSNNNKNGSVNKLLNSNASVGINDLIANLYRQSGNFEHESKDRLSHSDLNGNLSNSSTTEVHVNGDVMNSVVGTENFSWSPSGFDMEKLDSERSVVDFDTSGVNLDSNAFDSRSNGQDLGKNLSNSVVGANHLSWNPLSLDTKKFDLKKNIDSSCAQVNPALNILSSAFVDQNSSIRGVDPDSNGLSSNLFGQGNHGDEDDGWEFMATESKSQTEKEHVENDVMETENQPTVGFNVSNFSWNMPSPGSVGSSPNVNNGKTDGAKLTSDLNDGDDDSWDKEGWEFKGAEPEAPKVDMKNKIEGKAPGIVKAAEFIFGFESSVHQNGDLFGPSSKKPSGWAFGFDFNPSSTDNNMVFYSNAQSKENEREKDLNPFPNNGNVNSWAFKDSFSESGTMQQEEPVLVNISLSGDKILASNTIQKKEQDLEKPKGPLPLSFFSDGELENSNPVVHGDAPSSTPASSRAQNKTSDPNVSISDLISSLYAQAENKTSADPTGKLSDNGFGSTQTAVDSDSVNGDDDFLDDSWEFKGSVHAVTDSNMAKSDDGIDDDEFKGVYSENGAENLAFIHGLGDHEKLITKAELNDYVDFYVKLKNELCYIALDHMENLKKACYSAAGTGEGSEVKTSDEEIQDLHNQLHEDIMIHGGISLENVQPKSICISEIIQVLQEKKFQELESEYHLSRRLLLAEKDWKSAIELLKHAVVTMKILTLGSDEEHSNYVSVWTRIASVCAQELKHGASIWKQALEKEVHNEIFSKSQGQKYLLALGEIYRVARILSASTRLYKPWILLNPTSNVLAPLYECTTSWSTSGLEEALMCIISNLSEFQHNKYADILLKSIKHLDGLDSFALYNNVLSEQEPKCRISGLAAGTMPGMTMVVWNGEHCFVNLANLWANLISRDPPSLPHIHLG